MSSEKVTVVANIHAQAGKEAEVRQALLDLLAPTRAEAGCLNYDLHQLPADATRFFFHENWTSRAALDRHLGTPHVQAFLRRADALLAKPVDIQLWKQIG